MKIGILGTRGIPNYHGGFEQFAEYFSVYLKENGHDVSVYSSSSHPFKEKVYKGVNIIKCYDPEGKIGTVGQFIYDLNCIIDSRTQNFDILLQLGYTSSSIWSRLFPKKTIIVTNMDGLEWKRTKYSKSVQWFLKYAEKLGVKYSNFLISDSLGIQSYLMEKYNVASKFIAYGANLFNNPKESILVKYNLEAYKYSLLIARFEPENNLEIILDGVASSNNKNTFLVIGKHDVNAFGKYLKEKFKNEPNIWFIGGVFNIEHLNNLRYYSNIYFHGHSVGGTNPSLLEAMASKSLIVAHNNEFNKSVLGKSGFYFENSADVKSFIETKVKKEHLQMVESGYNRISECYNWELINNSYLDYFYECSK
ncbi:MAG: DUF1972 domain-containing protein [Flavobacteriaceae bacterium]|nr:DUF1972 domain-containing protein [Flavobacteriaceae bacterium]